jgi:putative membrane protein
MLLFLKGMFMGIANIIPGVSGGTIALITEIYRPFISSLKRLNLRALKLLLGGRFKAFYTAVNGSFLVPIFSGIVVSVVGLANLLRWSFENYPVIIWSLFFGIISASVYYIGRGVKKWDRTAILFAALGLGMSIGFDYLPAVPENHNLIYIFLCGMVSISGMTLPGVSGSFLLILMGNYQLLLIDSIAHFNALYVSIFAAGSVAGLVGFSYVLVWLLEHYNDEVMGALTGFVLGSLLIIWPWQEPISWVESDGERFVLQYRRFLPQTLGPRDYAGLATMILGAMGLILLEYFAGSQKKQDS